MGKIGQNSLNQPILLTYPGFPFIEVPLKRFDCINRLQKILISNQPIEQAGFWKSFSTMDHLHSINQIIEKCMERQVELQIAMIDYNKAFDSLSLRFMLKALKNQGIPNKLIMIVNEMYSGLKVKIITDKEGRNKGIHCPHCFLTVP